MERTTLSTSATLELAPLSRRDRLHANGLGGIVLLFVVPVLLDTVDASLGLVVSGPAFRMTIRLAALGALGALLWAFVRPPRLVRIQFDLDRLRVDGVGNQARSISYRRIIAAHAYGSGEGRRVIVGVRRNLPLSLPQAAFPSPAAIDEFLATLREHVRAVQGEEAMADYDARSTLGEQTSEGWIPVTTCFVLLCGLALVVAIAARVQADPLGMLRFGALSSAMVRAGEYERLISYVFVHWNLTHLWANVAPLIALGWSVERLLGWRLYALMLLSVTLVSSTLAMSSGGGVLRVGASGLVCAVFGVLLYLNVRRSRNLPPMSQVPMILWIMLLLVQGFLLIGWVRAGAPSTGIDHLGHAFGWIAGATVAAIATSRRSISELRSLRSPPLLAGPWIAAGVACAALSTSVMRAMGFTREDRVRAASVLMLAPETPPVLRAALARETVLNPLSTPEQVRRAQHGVRMLLRDQPYDGRHLDILSRAQARLGHDQRAVETARTALLWHPDKEAAAQNLARLMLRHHDEHGPMTIGGPAPDLLLQRKDDAWMASVSRLEAAQGRRGLVAYVVAHDDEKVAGLIVVRIGGFLRDSYALSGVPDWAGQPPWTLTTVARTAFELVDVPVGEAHVEAWSFPEGPR